MMDKPKEPKRRPPGAIGTPVDDWLDAIDRGIYGEVDPKNPLQVGLFELTRPVLDATPELAQAMD